MDASTSSGSHDSWCPQGYVRPSSYKVCLCHILELLLVMRCWSHKSLLFSRMSLILLKSGSQQCCPQPRPHSIVSGFHFPTSCREGRREWRKISSYYFSILCCLNNIHNISSIVKYILISQTLSYKCAVGTFSVDLKWSWFVNNKLRNVAANGLFVFTITKKQICHIFEAAKSLSSQAITVFLTSPIFKKWIHSFQL